MKTRFLSVLMLLALICAAGSQALPVQAITVPPLKPCSIYEIYSYKEANYRTNLTVGNFSAITLFADPKGVTGGQTNWVRLGLPEINFIQSINANSLKPWAWADAIDGTIYLGSGNDDADTSVRWPRIALGSNETGLHRNQVCVLERSTDGRFAHIQGIPKSANYYQYTKYAWLFNTAYTVYPADAGVPNRTGEVELYLMPLWEPSSGFTIPVGGGTGLWLPVQFLARKLGEFDPASVTSTVSPTVTPWPPTHTPAPTQAAFEMRVLDRNGKPLSVRGEPSMSSLSIGGLYPNAIINVEDLKYGDELDPESVWGRLGEHAWIAICYNRTLYTDFGCVPVR